MTSHTLFGQPPTPATLTTDHDSYTMGVQFSVSAPVTLTAIWFYSAGGAGALPATIALYAVSGASLVHSEAATWSSGASAGWVRAAFASPPSLTPATDYKACAFYPGGTDWYSVTAHYWDSGPGAGGITSGPLSAPASAGGDGGQDTFNTNGLSSGGVLAYPASSFNAGNYWVDPEVTQPGGLLMASGIV